MSSTTQLPPTLGGQAVVEGVMIRGPRGAAVCVRNPDGEIICETHPVQSASGLSRFPIVRGVVALGDTMGQGMRAMIWSAQVAAGQEPEQPSDSSVRATTALSLGFVSAFFLLVPALASRRLERRVEGRLSGGGRFSGLLEGLARIGMLVGYLRAIGRVPQAQRLFQYHGAEHRAIQAYEAGDALEVEELHKYPNAHVRCGTSFLLTTSVISSVVYAAIGAQSLRGRMLSRIVLMPVIAGLSYEAIRLGNAASGGPFSLIFRPNMALQSLTTSDPDEAQMEVALAAVKAALALHQDA
ncbi:MAG: DUF1385 domain-containing protein [Chloroflexi bacterium]|nr:DUF1385 domain-containing protein [Chloroflexota bacterium]MCH8007882.1 DUF1385 domain-containing protein [Chloroflexota bacterium]